MMADIRGAVHSVLSRMRWIIAIMPLKNTISARLRRAFCGLGATHLPTAVSGTSVALALTGVFWWSQQMAPVALASQERPRTTSSFNSGEARPAEDPALVARGKTLYGVNCQACHGMDLRGGDMGGPNLLRSQVALTDQHGEKIIPIIQGARQAQGMPNIGLNDEDAGAVAAYIRSVIGTIGSQGTPPGEMEALNVVVGNPERGRAYFEAHCASCHSVTGDLKGFASKYPEPRAMQARWILGERSVKTDGTRNATVDVTTAPGQVVPGTLVHIDDFLVTLRSNDGTERSYAREGAIPKVVVHDPLQKHREMLPTYTDDDIHNVTAYLVTLK
jgi:cytochrome c oxidase cbb3-type subunit 3